MINWHIVNNNFTLFRRFLLILLFFICAFGNSVNGQVDSIDSLEIDLLIEDSHKELINKDYNKAIKIAQSGYEQSTKIAYRDGVINSLFIMAESYRLSNDFPKALNYYLQLLSDQEKMSSEKELRFLKLKLGKLFYDWGVPEKALIYYKEALAITIEESDNSHISILNRLAETYINLNQYEDALAQYLDILKLQRGINSEEEIGTLKKIASIYTQLDDFENALKYNFDILHINQEMADSVKIAVALNAIGSLYKHLNDLPKSLQYYNEALVLNQQLNKDGNYDNRIVSNLINIGIVNQALGNYRISVRNFNEAFKVKAIKGTPVEIAVMHNYLASINYSLRKYGLAKDHTLEAISLLEDTENKRMLVTSYKRLSDIYQKLGNNGSALKSYEQYSILKDSIVYHDQVIQEREKYKQHIIVDAEKESKLALIDQELKASELRNERAKTEREKQDIQLKLNAKELQNTSLVNKQLLSEQEVQKLTLQQKQIEAQNKDQEIILLEQKRDLQEAELLKNELIEKEILKEIKLQKSNIELQQADLQASEIRQKNLIWLIGLSVLIVVLILFSYGVKQRANKKLMNKNREITSQKDQIEDINKELLELNDEKNDLIGIVAHDLKSPLNQITGLLEIISLTTEDKSSEQKENVAKINTSAERLKNLVSKILNVSAIESKTQNITFEEVNLKDLLLDTIKGFEELALKKEINIIKKIDSHITTSKLDSGFVTEVYMNLLSNAIKYSPIGKTVVLKMYEKGNSIRTEFIDQGQGISAQDMNKLFRKYYKLTPRPTDGEDSTGLGLSIVKKYVETMGGNVWCESEEGKGSNFIVEFEKLNIV